KYISWLQTLHPNAHGNSDIVAHFFRRSFSLIRDGAVFGLIATKTIAQGDTRESGLRPILESEGAVIRAVRRIRWPGEATVIIAVIHIIKGSSRQTRQIFLDGKSVSRISAYLVEGQLDESPHALSESSMRAFVGSYVLGTGFSFDDAG